MKSTTNKVLALLSIASLALAGSLTAHAQEPAPSVRSNIKAAIENRLEKNREVRNTILDKRQEMKEAKVEMRTEIKDMRVENRAEIKVMRASSTEMFKRNGEIRAEIMKKMERSKFEMRKNALIRELTLSIANLANISVRIEARIVKNEGQGKDMMEARALLIVANEKLAQSKIDVTALQDISLDQEEGTEEVELTKPRDVGDAAIKSVRDTKGAFQEVVRVIASLN